MAINSLAQRDSKHQFEVRIDGILQGRFSKCSELTVETDTATIHEGGAPLPFKQAGVAQIPDITLERGSVDGDNELYALLQRTTNAIENRGLNARDYKFTMDIKVLDRARNVLRRYACYGCFIKTYTIGDFDASASEILMEKITICCEQWELVGA